MSAQVELIGETGDGGWGKGREYKQRRANLEIIQGQYPFVIFKIFLSYVSLEDLSISYSASLIFLT